MKIFLNNVNDTYFGPMQPATNFLYDWFDSFRNQGKLFQW